MLNYFLASMFLTIALLNGVTLQAKFDVTVVGYILVTDGIGKRVVNFMEHFKDKLNINYIETYKSDYSYLSKKVLDIVKNDDKTPGYVSLFFNIAFPEHVSCVPRESIVKIAFSVFESTVIPDIWVYNFNKYFDAVVVPCEFLVKVYKDCGVKVPIFLLTEGTDLDKFLNAPIKKSKNRPFIFGMSAGLWPRKNHKMLIKAFLNKFGNNENVKLKIHGRPGCEKTKISLEKLIQKYKPNNVKLILRSINPDKYFKFMSSLDAYVMISKAEGFSFTPRESIALGIPTILSNNTAHKEMCKTPYFIPIKSDIAEPADYTWIIGTNQGYNFNILQSDLENALQDVYNNYDYYLEKSNHGRQWIKQFTYKSLEKRYLNLIKPKKVLFGPNNVVTDDYIMTNSKNLYEKYMLLDFHRSLK